MKHVTPLSPKALFSRNDPADPRLGDLTTAISDLNQVQPFSATGDDTAFTLFGYPDDEGIKINGGRIGAAEAPLKVRELFYRLTPDLNTKSQPRIFDLGNLDPTDLKLEERHELGRNLCLSALKLGQRWMGIGGGHDYGYCEATAFLESQRGQKALIINLDAHMDVRPHDKGKSSGTPFRRILEAYPNEDFLFLEVGIQSFCNSRAHVKWALSHPQTRIVQMDEIHAQGLLPLLKRHCEPIKGRPCFLSVDIDAFQSSEAMGCSQSWPSGLESKEFFPAFTYLIENFDMKCLGLYEVSPPLDQDNRTSKLAALIMEHYLRHQLRKGGQQP